MKNCVKREGLLILVMLLSMQVAFGQARLKGTIKDAKGEAIRMVTVHVLNTDISTLSNDAGVFSINSLNEGSYTLQFSSVGFASQSAQVTLKNGADNSIEVQMNTNQVQLEEITITAEKKEALLQKTALSISSVSAKQVLDYRL